MLTTPAHGKWQMAVCHEHRRQTGSSSHLVATPFEKSPEPDCTRRLLRCKPPCNSRTARARARSRQAWRNLAQAAENPHMRHTLRVRSEIGLLRRRQRVGAVCERIAHFAGGA